MPSKAFDRSFYMAPQTLSLANIIFFYHGPWKEVHFGYRNLYESQINILKTSLKKLGI